MLIFGREVNQLTDLSSIPPDTEVDESIYDYVKRLREAIWTAHETARDTIKTTQNRMKRDYDVRLLERQYKVGDIVYVLYTAKIKSRAKQLDQRGKGLELFVLNYLPTCTKLNLKKLL